MDPIINPWIFYWADVCGFFKKISIIIAISIFIISIFFFSLAITECYDDEDKTNIIKMAKLAVIALSIFIIMGVFIPSEKTIYKMVIAQNVTENNLAKGEEEIMEIIDHIYDRMNGGGEDAE